MKKYVIPACIACVVIIVAAAAFVLCQEDRSSHLYLGDHEITTDGVQPYQGYGNVRYNYETNTLVLDRANIYMDDGYREYGNIMMSVNDTGDAKFLISYEGTRDLNIYLYGDNKFHADTDDSVGGIYIAKNANVYVYGPGALKNFGLTHSLVYGKEASVSFSDVDVESVGMDVVTVLAADTMHLTNLDFVAECAEIPGVAALYAPNGTAMKNVNITSIGFDKGVRLGTSYIYDSALSFSSVLMGCDFYACVMYDTTVKSYSEGSGMSFYDPLIAYNCIIDSESKEYFAISSTETTIELNNCIVNAYVEEGIAIDAWKVLIYDSDVTAVADDGSGIVSFYNITAGGPGAIIAEDSSIYASGGTAAIWSMGELEIEGLDAMSNYKLLQADTSQEDIWVVSICDKNTKELEIFDDGWVNVYPLNAVKEITI